MDHFRNSGAYALPKRWSAYRLARHSPIYSDTLAEMKPRHYVAAQLWVSRPQRGWITFAQVEAPNQKKCFVKTHPI
jgi:hypothetical protein